MNIEQAVEVLRAHNKWRRNMSFAPTPYSGLELGAAIDAVCAHVEKSSASQRIGAEVRLPEIRDAAR